MKKIILMSFVFLVLMILIGIALQIEDSKNSEYAFPGAIETAKLYFESWGKKDWPNMYSVISDGFKKIEPTAKTLSDFRAYAENLNITFVKIIDLKEESNDGNTAIIMYSIYLEFNNGTKKQPSGKFALKYKEADVIKGWKIIQPYGEKTDIS